MRPVLAMVLGFTLLATPAGAQVFGQYTGAQPLQMSEHLFGAYLHAGDDAVGAIAQLRLSFYPAVDFGFQGGLSNYDESAGDVTTVRLGGDLKVRVMQADGVNPLDLAVGAALGVESGDDFNILTLGPSLIASRTFGTGGSTRITPYASLMLAFSNIDVGDAEDSDLSFPLRLGADWTLAPGFRLMGELQVRLSDEFREDTGFAIGVNLPF